MVETDVEFPTDTNLLYEAVRKALGLCAGLSGAHGLAGWRQDARHLRKLKKAHRGIQKLRHSTSKDGQKCQAREEEIKQAHRGYLGQAETLIVRVRDTRRQLAGLPAVPLQIALLDDYLKHAGLKEIVGQVVLPRKGKLSEAAKAMESEPEFFRLRRQHSAVESAINALEVHGLDRCPDHGIGGFKRYVALAVLARNIQRLGVVLKEQEAKRRRGPYKKAA